MADVTTPSLAATTSPADVTSPPADAVPGATPQPSTAAHVPFLPRRLHATTLEDFGYAFTADGTFKHTATGAGYHFLSQKHYDLVGDAVVEAIYGMLEASGLTRYPFPLDANTEEGEPSSPIFASKDSADVETAVLLCQGSGAVRPGMWARALCMNDNLDRGTVLPYIRDAQSRGWGVLVLNPNQRYAEAPPQRDAAPSSAADAGDSREVSVEVLEAEWVNISKVEWESSRRQKAMSGPRIAASESPQEHMLHAYRHVLPALFPNLKRLYIVAHSFGGKCVTSLLRHTITPDKDDDGATTQRFLQLVPAVALTDAINDLQRRDRKAVKQYVTHKCINWVASDAPLDTMMPPGPEGSLETSAGHPDHVHTSASCRTSVFALFDHLHATVPVGTIDEFEVARHFQKTVRPRVPSNTHEDVM